MSNFRENDLIETVCEIRRNNETIPQGTIGTVIHVYKLMEAIEIEFPGEKIITLLPDEIQKT